LKAAGGSSKAASDPSSSFIGPNQANGKKNVKTDDTTYEKMKVRKMYEQQFISFLIISCKILKTIA
jgi:hypothetical protein